MIRPSETSEPQGEATDGQPVRIPLLTLPRRVPKQVERSTQSNIPDDRNVRAYLKRVADEFIKREGIVPPLGFDELRDHTESVRKIAKFDATYNDYISVLVGNSAWRDALAEIPYDRRLLLLPKCLRVEEHCPAPFDEFGLLCKECGLCSLHDLTVEAERLGYAVLVAEGSAIVRAMIETGRIEGIVGVSCLNVLEKCFPHLEATAVPGVAIPLLQDDCVNTTVDLDWVWDVIHLTSSDRTYRMDLEALKSQVKEWFTLESLHEILGDPADETTAIGYEWLADDGKRWRPYLTACAYLALTGTEQELPDDLKKIAVAVECFHKASLIHDDIEDGDTLRYGRPTLNSRYGTAVALNVGDLLLGEGYRLISEVELGSNGACLLNIASMGHLTLSRGQGAELLWASKPRVLTSLEVLDIFRQKTAPAFEVALRLGAALGGATEDVHDVLHEYSESLGIAYQIRDDLEDFEDGGDSNDLRDMRPSIIMSIAHKRAGSVADKKMMESLWNRTVCYDDKANDIQRIIKEGGVTTKAGELREAYTEQAISSLRTLTNPTLKGLLRRVVGKMFGDNLIEGYCSEFEARNAAGGETRAEPAA